MKQFFLHTAPKALKNTGRYWRIILVIYFIEFILALIISSVAVRWIEMSIGERGSMETLLNGWDQIVVSDLLNTYGSGFWVWFTWFIITTMILVVLRQVWNAGLFYQFWQNNSRFRVFRKGICCHIGSVLVITVPFVILSFIWLAIFSLLVIYQFKYTIFENEHVFWQVNGLLLFIGFGGVKWLQSAALFSQNAIVGSTEANFWNKFKKAFHIPFGKVTGAWLLDLIILVIFLTSFYFIANLELQTGMKTSTAIFLYFLAYQILHFSGRYLMTFIRKAIHDSVTTLNMLE